MTDFKGFTLPDGAWLPPELILILPRLNQSQLKVLLVIIYHNTQIGGSEPVSLTYLEKLTGISRPSVTKALQALLKSSLIVRNKIGQSFTYEPLVKIFNYQVVVSSLKEGKEERIEREQERSDSLSLSLTEDQLTFLNTLRSNGVFIKTAYDLIANYELEFLQVHLDYYRYALKIKMANGPGYLVESIKNKWQTPLGFHNDKDSKDTAAGRNRYTDWEDEE